MVAEKLRRIKHHKPDHAPPKGVPKHPDHEHVKKRHEKYVTATLSRDIEAQLKFFSPDCVLIEMNYGTEGTAVPYSEFRLSLELMKDEFFDIKCSSKSLHGTKHFCTWEYDCSVKNLVSPTGEILTRETAEEHVISAVDLMWWNDEGKIEKIHRYTIHRDVHAVRKEQEENKGEASSTA